jgi:hypothetical protein
MRLAREAFLRILALMLVLGVAQPAGLFAQDRWDLAERSIRRLSPDGFPGLPEEVRDGMLRSGCVVPQGSHSDHPHNVIAGRFASPSQVDWAFLCSADGVSSIHVLWGGAERCRTPVSPMEDRAFLQGLGGDSIGFSRRLMPVERNRMLAYASEFEGPPVPDIWHQGIEDYFEGKASTVLLCVNGRWITLAGID